MSRFRALTAPLTASLTGVLSICLTLMPTLAAADSCWWHNGSLMSLYAHNEFRIFRYENPRPGLVPANVGHHTVMFNGTNVNGYYSGTARVFSESCWQQPQEYAVSGPVGPNQTSVTLYGTRELRNGCAGTGQFVQDTLTFTYAFQC